MLAIQTVELITKVTQSEWHPWMTELKFPFYSCKYFRIKMLTDTQTQTVVTDDSLVAPFLGCNYNEIDLNISYLQYCDKSEVMKLARYPLCDLYPQKILIMRHYVFIVTFHSSSRMSFDF